MAGAALVLGGAGAWGCCMTEIQRVAVYSDRPACLPELASGGGVPVSAVEASGLFFSESAAALVAVPTAVAGEAVVSVVVGDLIQDIRQDTQEPPKTEQERQLQLLLNMSRTMLALQIIQDVYEANMQALLSISDIKIQTNPFQRRSDDYFKNPFEEISLLGQMPGGTGQLPCLCAVTDDAPVEPTAEEALFGQLMQVLGEQWAQAQQGQTEWLIWDASLDTLLENNIRNNNTLDNQNTSLMAYLNDWELSGSSIPFGDLLY